MPKKPAETIPALVARVQLPPVARPKPPVVAKVSKPAEVDLRPTVAESAGGSSGFTINGQPWGSTANGGGSQLHELNAGMTFSRAGERQYGGSTYMRSRKVGE